MNFTEARKELPIYQIRNKLITEIQKNSCLILLGETGCGKTTQIPQYIYESQPKMKGLIACTQPRRVAAITVAMRVSEEMRTHLGNLVGYSVRFEDVTSAETRIKYMTDGMLLREAINDSLLQRYTVIILDEIHERTVHTDILLGIVKKAQKERLKGGLKPLKLILMSATMDVDIFSKYFNDAPVLYLEGRQYPIDIFHSASVQNDYIYASIVCTLQIHRQANEDEDILLFLTGQEEIESVCKTLIELNSVKSLTAKPKPLLALPLYASLPHFKQLKVFEKAPQGVRKVIVSTNVAETSITIRNIKYVIDAGMIKGKLFNANANLEVLKVHKISKSQAWQRAGRAGRESPGVCYRLYTEQEYELMQASTVPELLRSNLASIILQLLAIGIKSPEKFDFVDKPDEVNINAAMSELEMLNAVTKSTDNVYELTCLGRKMSSFPLDPKYAKCIISAEQYECVEDVLKIVSLLSVDSVFVHSSKNSNFLAIKEKFTSADGDHITLLNVFKAFISAKMNKEWCRENCLDSKNLHLAKEICKQLRDICQKEGIHVSSRQPVDTVNIRKAFIHGFFMNTAEYFKENEFKTLATQCRQLVQIHPSSVLFNSKPSCLLFNELVLTNKHFMRDLCVISGEWLMEINASYFKNKIKITL